MKQVPTRVEMIELCRGCKGHGIDHSTGQRCETCEGSGRVRKIREIVTKIEPHKKRLAYQRYTSLQKIRCKGSKIF